MPLAGYAQSNKMANRNDCTPDPNQLWELVSERDHTITYYKLILNPETNKYERIVVDVKTQEEIMENKNNKTYEHITPDDRKKASLQKAADKGMFVAGVDKSSKVSMECRCGFVAPNEVSLFRHKAACTYLRDKAIIEQEKAEQLKAVKDKKDGVIEIIDPVEEHPRQEKKGGSHAKSK